MISPLDPKFGGKGDGLADDTGPLRSAAIAAARSGDWLDLRGKVYRAKASLAAVAGGFELFAGLKVHAAGANVLLYPTVPATSSNWFRLPTVESDVVCRDLTIRRMESFQTAGMRLVGSNVSFLNLNLALGQFARTGHAVQIGLESCSDVSFLGGSIEGGNYGVWMRSSDRTNVVRPSWDGVRFTGQMSDALCLNSPGAVVSAGKNVIQDANPFGIEDAAVLRCVFEGHPTGQGISAGFGISAANVNGLLCVDSRFSGYPRHFLHLEDRTRRARFMGIGSSESNLKGGDGAVSIFTGSSAAFYGCRFDMGDTGLPAIFATQAPDPSAMPTASGLPKTTAPRNIELYGNHVEGWLAHMVKVDGYAAAGNSWTVEGVRDFKSRATPSGAI